MSSTDDAKLDSMLLWGMRKWGVIMLLAFGALAAFGLFLFGRWLEVLALETRLAVGPFLLIQGLIGAAALWFGGKQLPRAARFVFAPTSTSLARDLRTPGSPNIHRVHGVIGARHAVSILTPDGSFELPVPSSEVGWATTLLLMRFPAAR